MAGLQMGAACLQSCLKKARADSEGPSGVLNPEECCTVWGFSGASASMPTCPSIITLYCLYCL